MSPQKLHPIPGCIAPNPNINSYRESDDFQATYDLYE